jgi:inorganic pyrophosphatase
LARSPEITPIDRETGALKIVIETPKGSRNKYKYQPDNDCLELTTALPEGMNFPYDFGFVPSTLGPDGDPLDVLVLMDAPVVPGCVIRARLLGVIKARQREKEEKKRGRNDRLIAVACHAQTHQEEKSLKDLRPHLTDEIGALRFGNSRPSPTTAGSALESAIIVTRGGGDPRTPAPHERRPG